ncbi:MAG TPA: EAL domain-containing protein [Aliidongia sp.]|uniref:putative bifunctional diguanylate cyclase/phosphodiesterase n=1 Tax=Aliidongia sp. TaxID=1914230 RepID=UPI002DDCBD72|nr:EAL domain-containing protein [Aliidongia sp.]HEV2673936.1 EAL domain-containing protein [Aliidongia sp.]
MAETALDREFLWNLLENIPAMIWVTDADHGCIHVNRATLAFTGRTLEQMLHGGWRETIHPDDLVPLDASIAAHHQDHTPLRAEIRNRRRDGEYRWMQVHGQPLFDPDGTYRGTIGLSLDITDAKRHEHELARMVTHDKLTGLPNRALMESLIEAAVDSARGDGRKLPVLTFGVDRFQTINETQGHGAGDALLAEVGRRIGLIRHGHEVAGHLSGNRFVMIGEAGVSTENAYRTAGRLLDLCRVPFRLNDVPHELSASIGISIFPDDGHEPGELMRAAEAALQTAKQLGGNHFAFFDRDLHGNAKNRFDLETDLRRAIPAGELVLHFQPKVSLPDYRLVGFEALVRWQHPERGMLPPVTFVNLAEEAGLIGPLTRWVFEAVGRQQREWIDAGLVPVPIAVNVSPREFLGDLLEEHLAAYKQYDLPDGLMEIEITESTMIDDFDRVCRIVQTLTDAGIKVAMDDFGTGYSSLANLNRLPISTLKIDRAFTKDVDWDRASRAVASAIISLAAELGLDVVAEGVETREQLNVLRTLKCTVVQGFLTGRPVPADEAVDLLRHPSPIPTARALIEAARAQ